MFKRIYAVVLSMIVFAMSSVCAFASSLTSDNSALKASKQANISVQDVSGNVGDTITVNIKMTDNPGIIVLRLRVSYDNKCLQMTDARDAGLFEGANCVFSNSYKTNPFVMLWEDSLATKNHTKNGTIATMKFKIISDLGSSGSAISIEVTDAYNCELNNVTFTTSKGKVLHESTTAKTTTTTPSTTKTTTKTTTAAKLPEIDTKITRLSGSDRVSTAIGISKSGWKKSKNVVLAYAMNYPDALAGAPLAYALDAPILLTANKDALETSVLAEIDRLGAKNVYILGGTAAVNDKISSALKSKGLSVERISGSRYETAVAIAEKLVDVTGKKPKEVFVVSGVNFPDALAISSIAATKKCPILFAPSTGSLDKATANFITASKCRDVILLGGTAAVSDGVKISIKGLGVNVERVSGNDRYATALAIYKKYDNKC